MSISALVGHIQQRHIIQHHRRIDNAAQWRHRLFQLDENLLRVSSIGNVGFEHARITPLGLKPLDSHLGLGAVRWSRSFGAVDVALSHFVGTRIGFNDKQSTELLLGGIVDVKTGATALGLEASRRLGQRWKLSVEGRVFSSFPPDDPAHAFRNDSHLKVELAWYF